MELAQKQCIDVNPQLLRNFALFDYSGILELLILTTFDINSVKLWIFIMGSFIIINHIYGHGRGWMLAKYPYYYNTKLIQYNMQPPTGEGIKMSKNLSTWFIDDPPKAYFHASSILALSLVLCEELFSSFLVNHLDSTIVKLPEQKITFII